MHPRLPAPHIFKELWQDRQWLVFASLQFAQGKLLSFQAPLTSLGVARHTLGVCVNGVFDRFPRVKYIIGHSKFSFFSRGFSDRQVGEGIPQDLWRMDHFNYRLEPYRV